MHDMHLENGCSLGNLPTVLVGTLPPATAHGIRITLMGNPSVQSRRSAADSKRRGSLGVDSVGKINWFVIILMSDIWTNIKDFWEIFRYYLFVNSTEEPTYLLTRQHMGSTAALGIAGYNTFLLRQKIIKNAIHLTKSNNPNVVAAASAVVSLFYFSGLAVVWHVPSFFAELAVRVYCSS